MFHAKTLAGSRLFASSSRVASSYGASAGAEALQRKTLADIRKKFASKVPISMVTAHDYITAKYAEAANIDITLVGDSLAMTALGYEDTNEIPFDEFLYHVKAVHRGNKSSFLMADVPFGTFETGNQQALSTAIQLVKMGKAQAIKMECGAAQLDSVAKIVDMGIPVMGHVGLTPQRHNAFGGFKLQGNSVDRALDIYKECLELKSRGVFALLLECIPNKLAEYITAQLQIPTIGIGAGPSCSGQVLVAADMLGMNNPSAHQAKFVKQYARQYDDSVRAYRDYVADLESGAFPSADLHGYKMKKDVLEEFKHRASSLSGK
ncbi:3-methyl-2-oxobutanoate hydroxymethyltransferase [[Candida] zeylanoides]